MTGIIISIPPAAELPPGSVIGNSQALPGISYQFAITSLPQTWTAQQTFNAGIVVNGSITLNSPLINAPTGINFSDIGTLGPILPYVVAGNGLSALSSLHVNAASTTATNAQFLGSFELLSQTGHGLGSNANDRVALYAGTVASGSSGDVWSFNTLVSVDNTAQTDINIHGYELDLNNNNANRGSAAGSAGMANPSAIGLDITGFSIFTSTAGIRVGGAGGTNNWYRGIGVSGSVTQEAFYDYSNATASYSDRGIHTNGVDLAAGTYSGSAIRIGNGHKITARNAANSADLLLIQLDSTNSLALGNDASISGIVLERTTLPGIDNTYSLGNASFRWADFRSVLSTIGTLIATTINGNTFTSGSGTLTLGAGKTATHTATTTFAGTDGKTLTISNSLALAGTDGTTLTFQGSDTYVARATTDTLTNKSISGATNTLTAIPQTAINNLGLVLISTQTASASATIDFTGLDNTYNSYLLVISAAVPATNDVEAWLRIGTGGTPTYQTSGYEYGNSMSNQGAAAFLNGAGAAGQMVMSALNATSQGIGNGSGKNYGATIEFQNPATIEFPTFQWRSRWNRQGDNVLNFSNGGGQYSASGAITAVRFMFSSGNITSGNFALYGYRKS